MINIVVVFLVMEYFGFDSNKFDFLDIEIRIIQIVRISIFNPL